MIRLAKSTSILLVIFTILLTTFLPAVPVAAWSTSPTENTPVCTAADGQERPQLVSDSSGGAIIVWMDDRGVDLNIYTQRVNDSGSVLWTDNGTAICTAGSTWEPQLVSDGSGGAIIAWEDYRSLSHVDIYAQRVNASGSVLWTDNGTAICTETNNQEYFQLISDGSGGAIIAWVDKRSDSGDIYAQRVNASGSTLWTDNGTAICTAADYQDYPQLVSDGSGGAIIAWQDNRSGNYDIYAQRVNASGSAQWSDNGTAICTEVFSQYSSQLVSDGSGGAIIVWEDQRSTYLDIYAQRVNASGSAQWSDNGTAICTAAFSQRNLQLVSDGSGGAIITWQDQRIDTGDVYAQRVNASGSAIWSDNGTAICTATNHQSNAQLVSDGSGGAIITWQDQRSGSNNDIYAQLVNASGSAIWSDNGTAICTAAFNQYQPQLVSDGSGGAIITWMDYRSGNWDVYAQMINSSGDLGTPPDISVSPTTIDFGFVTTGSSSSAQTVTISNDGIDNSLNIGTITIGGTNAAEFSKQNDTASGQTIAPGGSATLEVVFSPSSAGAKTASLSISSDDPDEATVTVILSGTGYPENIPICTEVFSQYSSQLVSDSSGGAIIVWEDSRSGNRDIYAQRVDSSGSTLWTDNGTAICTAANDQNRPQLVSDGVGGAIITWEDYRAGSHYDVYAQRVDASGNTLWTDNGTAISATTNYQKHPQLISDGSGGAIIAWEDQRYGGLPDVFAQRVDSSGNALWTDNGTAICTANERQTDLQLVSDGSGGAIIVWEDWRGGMNNTSVYAQRINTSGSALWTDNGTAICTAAFNQYRPQLVSDSSGGAIIVWQDYRGGSNFDIYAQRINTSGSTLWSDNGTAICTAPDRQEVAHLVSDVSGGAIIAWDDYRKGNNWDIYAQLVNSSGSLGLPPDISVSPTMINFGSVATGSSSSAQTVTINNDGTDNGLSIGTITIGGTNAAEFSKQNDNASGQTIVPGGSATLEVVFSPSSAGDKTATLSIPSDDPDEATVTVSLSGNSPSPSPPPDDGEDGGVIHTYSYIDVLGKKHTLITDYIGGVYKSVEATSPDGTLTMNIPKNTVIKDKNGRGLHTLNVAVNDNPPPTPEDKNIIGLTYDFEPAGATFNPPITLSFKYDPKTLPEGIAEEGLVLAFFDKEAGEWIELECTVDTENHTITALVSHFTDFAILGTVPPLPPTVPSPPSPPAPAAFSVSNLTVSPTEVKAEEPVTITVSVANSGGTEGSYEVVLKINGVEEAEETVTVAAGKSTEVSFSVTKADAGSYNVVVDGLSGGFTVTAPATPVPPTPSGEEEEKVPAPAKTFNWPLVIGIIAALIVVALLTFFLVRRKA